jgi:hypothetical protein
VSFRVDRRGVVAPRTDSPDRIGQEEALLDDIRSPLTRHHLIGEGAVSLDGGQSRLCCNAR